MAYITKGIYGTGMESRVVERGAASLNSVLKRVYRYHGYDFRNYKRGTMTRRLARRLYSLGLETYREYMQFLDHHPEEYPKLIDDLTIKVSSFFRNPYSFKRMAARVLPAMVSDKGNRGERVIRVWSCACAQGEEPYSIAIMFNEFLGKKRADYDIFIYATDISQSALKIAESGTYSPQKIKGLSTEKIQRYFIRRGQGYEVKESIREMVGFSQFDLTSAARRLPFSGLDCVFCCNVLIYLQKGLQDRVLQKLYGALATPGYLVLGEVETLTNCLREEMECLDNKAKIYKKDI